MPKDSEKPRRRDPIALMIRKLRRERGWSQKMLASEAGVGRATVARIELGGRNITLNSLFQVAQALGADVTLTVSMPGDRAQLTLKSERVAIGSSAAETPKD